MVTMILIALLVIFAGVIFGTWLNANSFKDTLKIIFSIPIIYYFFVKQEIDVDQKEMLQLLNLTVKELLDPRTLARIAGKNHESVKSVRYKIKQMERDLNSGKLYTRSNSIKFLRSRGMLSFTLVYATLIKMSQAGDLMEKNAGDRLLSQTYRLSKEDYKKSTPIFKENIQKKYGLSLA